MLTAQGRVLAGRRRFHSSRTLSKSAKRITPNCDSLTRSRIARSSRAIAISRRRSVTCTCGQWDKW
jgi:hypothetical protein